MTPVRRSLFLPVLLVAAVAACPSGSPFAATEGESAVESRDAEKSVVPDERGARLDRLFEDLKNAEDEAEGRRIEQRIWALWTRPYDPDLAERMSAAMEARRWYDYDKAIRILNAVIEDRPDYAEGWNQRATVYFQLGNYERSLRDIYETLAREPRHFGALAGRAVIRLRQGKAALAIQNLKTALEIHPYLRERTLYEQLSNPFDGNSGEQGPPIER